MKNLKFFWIAIAIIGIALIYWKISSKGSGSRVQTAVLPSPSALVSVLGTPSAKSLDQLTPQEIERLVNGGLVPTSVPYSKLTKPATCQVGGTVEFLSVDTSTNLNARLAYTGIDSPARQIKWKIEPTDGLRVGPNLTAQLNLPDGQADISVGLPKTTKSKNYSLTASMTYGRLEGQGVKVYEVSCAGTAKIKLDF